MKFGVHNCERCRLMAEVGSPAPFDAFPTGSTLGRRPQVRGLPRDEMEPSVLAIGTERIDKRTALLSLTVAGFESVILREVIPHEDYVQGAGHHPGRDS